MVGHCLGFWNNVVCKIWTRRANIFHLNAKFELVGINALMVGNYIAECSITQAEKLT